MVGWNEDEYTFFAWERRDSTSFNLDFDGLRARLEPRFSTVTARIIETYRASRPKATPTDIYVAVQSVTMMGLGSIEIAEKKATQGGAPVYLYNFGYKSESKIPGTDYAMGTPHAMDIAFKFNNVVTPSFFSGARPERLVASRKWRRCGRPLLGLIALPPLDSQRGRPTISFDAPLCASTQRVKSSISASRGTGTMEGAGHIG
jgi:para-nitrobenzyl esterase